MDLMSPPFLGHEVSLFDETGVDLNLPCVGTIISSYLILTVASCLYGNENRNGKVLTNLSVKVKIKSGNGQNSNSMLEEKQIRRISRIIFHPHVKNSSSENDVAILVLDENLNSSTNILPILSLSNETASESTPTNFSGRLCREDSEFSPLKISEASQCSFSSVKSDQFCLFPLHPKEQNFTSENSSCSQPFPGSILFCSDEECQGFLCGILASLPGKLGVNGQIYTNITRHLKWIESVSAEATAKKSSKLNEEESEAKMKSELLADDDYKMEPNASDVKGRSRKRRNATDETDETENIEWVPLIAHGKKSEHIPYHLSLRYNNNTRARKNNHTCVEWEHVCGAVILDEETVITAAHCFSVSDDHRHFRLISGRTRLHFSAPGEQVRPVKKILIHPDYRSTFTGNDIAILYVDKFHFNKNVGGVSLSPFYSEKLTGREVVISGWGNTTQSSGLSESLQNGTVSILDTEDCLNRLTNKMKKPVRRGVLCTLNKLTRTCAGDSGGPVVIQNYAADNFAVGNCTVGNVTMGNSTMGNLTVGGFTIGNCAVHKCTVGNCILGNCTIGDFTVGSFRMSNCTAGNLTMGNCAAGNCILDDFTVSNCTVDNFKEGNFTVGNLTVGNFTVGNFTMGNFTMSNCTVIDHIRTLLVGIVSFGSSNCSDTNRANIFTEVSSFYYWIQANRATPVGGDCGGFIELDREKEIVYKVPADLYGVKSVCVWVVAAPGASKIQTEVLSDSKAQFHPDESTLFAIYNFRSSGFRQWKMLRKDRASTINQPFFVLYFRTNSTAQNSGFHIRLKVAGKYGTQKAVKYLLLNMAGGASTTTEEFTYQNTNNTKDEGTFIIVQPGARNGRLQLDLKSVSTKNQSEWIEILSVESRPVSHLLFSGEGLWPNSVFEADEDEPFIIYFHSNRTNTTSGFRFFCSEQKTSKSVINSRTINFYRNASFQGAVLDMTLRSFCQNVPFDLTGDVSSLKSNSCVTFYKDASCSHGGQQLTGDHKNLSIYNLDDQISSFELCETTSRREASPFFLTAYEFQNYTGNFTEVVLDCSCLGFDWEWNNRINSVKNPQNLCIIAYELTSCQGRSVTITSDHYNFHSDRMHNKLTSFRICPGTSNCPTKSPFFLMAYESENYEGDSTQVSLDCDCLDLDSEWRNRINSVRNPLHLCVLGYEQTSCEGTSVRITSNHDSLQSDGIYSFSSFRICPGTSKCPIKPPFFLTAYEFQNYEGDSTQVSLDCDCLDLDSEWNNRIKSVRNPQNLCIIGYEQTNCQGRSVKLTSYQYSLEYQEIYELSSFQLCPGTNDCPTKSPFFLTAFEFENYKGNSTQVSLDCDCLGVETEWNNRINSVKNPQNLCVMGYADFSCKGDSTEIFSNSSSFQLEGMGNNLTSFRMCHGIGNCPSHLNY